MKIKPTSMFAEDRIPLLIYYSPSHMHLFESYFYPSYLRHLSADFDLNVVKGAQLCESLFRQGNWNQQVKEKVILVNNFIQSASHEYFLFSDVDVIFYKNIRNELLEEIEGYDLILQNDSTKDAPNTLCSGFYFCKINDSTRSFFKKIVSNFDDQLDDQQNFNVHLSCDDKLRYKALSSRFYNLSYSPSPFWYSGCSIEFPEFPIVMYHANFTIGVDNKEILLKNFQILG
jgi:hypothetical protein